MPQTSVEPFAGERRGRIRTPLSSVAADAADGGSAVRPGARACSRLAGRSRRARAAGAAGRWLLDTPRAGRTPLGVCRAAGLDSSYGPGARHLTPKKIGKFEIEALLGEGAMGTVYRARDPVLDRLVALKTVSPRLLAERETFIRFQREARAAARLRHPNIVTIYELGEVEGTLFIAMELLEGMDLAEAMVPPQRLSLDQKLGIIVQVARALDFAHKRGVVHRDVKPANIRLVEGLTVKIVDFGIAHLGGSQLTQAGTILGTPSYIAPEVLRGGRVDHRADVWAVGVILYELLTGIRPFDAPTVTSLILKIVNEPPPPINAAALGLPPGLAAIALNALSKDPAARFQDLEELAREVAGLVQAGPAGSEPLSPAERTREYDACVAEARVLLQRDELEAALETARRGQALEPSGARVLALIDDIERRLRESTTLVEGPESALSAGAQAGASPPAGGTLGAAGDLLDELRRRGAAVFHELVTFGGPPVTSTAGLSPAGDLLAAAGGDGAIRLWRLDARTVQGVLRSELHLRTGHDAAGVTLAFGPGGAWLATGHVDGCVHLWDVTGTTELPVRLKHEGSVGALAFSPDGVRLASGGVDGVVKLWDLSAARAGEARRELQRQPASVTALAFARLRAWLLTGHTNKVVRILDAATLRLTATLHGAEGAVQLLCLAPDERRLALTGQDRVIRLFDLDTRQALFASPAQRRAPTGLAFFSNGQGLASVDLDNTVTFWDLTHGTTCAVVWGARDEAFVSVAFAADGRRLVAALADGRVRIWARG